MVTFSKIKFDGVVVELTWTTTLDGGGEIVHTLKSTDAPKADFAEALRAMVPHVLDVLELDGCGLEDAVAVTGLSINTEEDGRRGLVCTCRRPLDIANAPFVFNTPHLREFVGDDTLKGFIPDKMFAAMEAVERAAGDYLKGKRGQGDLFEDLAPKADSGISSVTISAGGKSVTLERKGKR